jgi:hypothetical protein
MHDLYTLKDKLVKELEEYGRRDLSESSLKTIDTLAHAAKNIGKVIECCEDEDYSHSMGGYSRRGYSMGDASYDDGRYMRPDGTYSYARGRGRGAKRDSMGRYSRAEDDMTMQLEKLMDSATDEHTRKEIRRLIDQM